MGLDGKLRFQGRADDQVKISGYRIELDEISTCLLQAPGVSDAVAVVHRLNQQAPALIVGHVRSEEHTSELQSLMRISYAVFCLKKKKKKNHNNSRHTNNNTHNNTN